MEQVQVVSVKVDEPLLDFRFKVWGGGGGGRDGLVRGSNIIGAENES